MSNLEPRRQGDEQWDDAATDALASIEEAIRAAGSYVVPTDDLRPRTLEAARELSEDRRGGIRLGRFAAVLLVFMLVSVPIAGRLSAWYGRVASPSSAELQKRALQIATDRSIGPHWGLFEAFSQLRRDQATKLGRATPPASMK